VKEAKVSAVDEEEVAESCEASGPDEDSKKGSDGEMGYPPDKMKAEGNDEEISDGEMESLPVKVKVLEESLATEKAKTERILFEANKQSAFQFDELRRSDYERRTSRRCCWHLVGRRRRQNRLQRGRRQRLRVCGGSWRN